MEQYDLKCYSKFWAEYCMIDMCASHCTCESVQIIYISRIHKKTSLKSWHSNLWIQANVWLKQNLNIRWFAHSQYYPFHGTSTQRKTNRPYKTYKPTLLSPPLSSLLWNIRWRCVKFLMLWNVCLVMQRCSAFFKLLWFNTVKLCYFACPKWLIGLIKSWTINGKARKRLGRAGRQRE